MSYSLWPHGLQHSTHPCPSLSSRACSNSCSLSWWYHPTISTSAALFSSCLQSLPASGSFSISRLLLSGGQSIRASVSIFTVNIQGWFPLGLTGLISLLSKGISRVSSSTTVQKHQFTGFIMWKRQWHPTPVLLPGKSHRWRSLVGCSPWDRQESDTTERLYFHFSLSCIGEGNGNPLQCPCLENPRDRGAWWADVSGVAQSRTWLKRLSSSSSSIMCLNIPLHVYSVLNIW